MDIKNAKIDNNEIVLTDWPNPITTEGLTKKRGFTLINKIAQDTFRLVSNNEWVDHVNGEELREYIKINEVYNCTLRDGNYYSIDTHNIRQDNQFEQLIAEKYKRHIALTTLLGHGMEFDYVIEGEQVKLKGYTGTAKEVIVPRFVTTILENAFGGTKIEALKLDTGLKYIGGFAFDGCNISEIIVPETVELICVEAFGGNDKLVDSYGEYKDTIKLLNKNTVTIKNYLNYTN